MLLGVKFKSRVRSLIRGESGDNGWEKFIEFNDLCARCGETAGRFGNSDMEEPQECLMFLKTIT
jgi:hypothetical protein